MLEMNYMHEDHFIALHKHEWKIKFKLKDVNFEEFF